MAAVDDRGSRTGDQSDVSAQASLSGATGAWSGTAPLPSAEDDLVGTTLCNTYVIEKVLGEGGMGRVYQARHTRIKRKGFAVKTLHREFLRNPDVVRRFQREAEAAAAITSDHVIGVYDVDKTPDGRPFIAAELLDGVELGDLLGQRGKLPIAEAVRIVRQICLALSAAHGQGVIHRDMKPANVFLTGDLARPHVKVFDFGISRLDDDGGATSLTKTGFIMGTPSFMPPEQARGEPVDHRADIYSVGAILYTSVTGRMPFNKADVTATVVAVLTEEPPRPRSLEPAIPDGLEAIIQRAMAKSALDRFESMDELFDALAIYDTGVGDARKASVHAEDSAIKALERASAAKDARTLFVILCLIGVLALAGGLLMTLTSVVLSVRGAPPTQSELIWAVLAVLAVAATPAVLLVRAIRRSAWSNTVRMVELTEKLRASLLGALALYGFGRLLVGTADHVFLGRLWPGWDGVLFLAALGAALSLLWLSGTRFRSAAAAPNRIASLASAAVPTLALTTAVAAALLLRDGTEAPDAGQRGKPTSATSDRTAQHATPEEIAIAEQGGIARLVELASRYPKDGKVVRSLLLAYARTPSGWAPALEAADRLYELDAEALSDREVASVIQRAADAAPEISKRAMAILSTKMRGAGPDILYELSGLAGSAAAAPARELLTQGDVRARASAALLIAFDIREAKGCQAKSDLLDRAMAAGDERVVTILQPLTTGSSRGCGFLGLKACPAPCQAQAAKMRQVIQAIRARKG